MTLNQNDSDLLLRLASYRAACCLGFKHTQVKQILLSNGDEVSAEGSPIDPALQQENCLLFIRMCRALDGVFGGNLQEEKEWVRAESEILHGIPQKLMESHQGLTAVVSYLEGLLRT